MEVILKRDVENLGFTDDLVEVKNGYGRNFLIPQGAAILATPSAKKVLAETLRQRAHRDEKLIADAKEVAKTLEGISIKIIAKTADGSKLFGSVNNADVAEELGKQGHEIEKNAISIDGRNIKRIGDYVAHVRLHRAVIVDLPFSIAPDPKSLPKKKKVEVEDNVIVKQDDNMFGKQESIDDVIGQIGKSKTDDAAPDFDEMPNAPEVEATATEAATTEAEAPEVADTDAKTEE
jgi:large subunit ribosomal protein L9